MLKKELEGKIDAAITDLTLLWAAINEGHQTENLLHRVSDIQRRLAEPGAAHN